jgi:hypothetical protein
VLEFSIPSWINGTDMFNKLQEQLVHRVSTNNHIQIILRGGLCYGVKPCRKNYFAGFSARRGKSIETNNCAMKRH